MIDVKIQNGELSLDALHRRFGAGVELKLKHLCTLGIAKKKSVLREAKAEKTERVWQVAVPTEDAYALIDGAIVGDVKLTSDAQKRALRTLLESDLLTVMKATTEGSLSETEVKFADKHACCVIMASDGYPQKYESGFEIKIADDVKDNVYVAGAKIEDGILKTAGGRVLGVTAVEETLEKAIDSSYAKVQKVSFDNAYYRKDIGKKAKEAK